jgi:hypothetical protein
MRHVTKAIKSRPRLRLGSSVKRIHPLESTRKPQFQTPENRAERGDWAMGTGFGVECARYSGRTLQKIRDHRVAPIFSLARVLPLQNRSALHSRRAELEPPGSHCHEPRGRLTISPTPQLSKTHMKITIDISVALFEQVRTQAKDRGLTVRAMVESGLRMVMAQPKPDAEPFHLRDFSFGASGAGGELGTLSDHTKWCDAANPEWTVQDGRLIRADGHDSGDSRQ